MIIMKKFFIILVMMAALLGVGQALADTKCVFPPYKKAYAVSEEVYRQAAAYHRAHYDQIPKPDRFVIIDYSRRASQPRLLYLDLAQKTFSTHHVAAGRGSDPDGDGYATKFSNEPDSKMSSLGAFLTLKTYNGKYGYSLYLKGLDSTNDQAENRDIVMHPASYVNESQNKAGRSWGCPSLDPAISTELIDKIKNGTIIFAGTKGQS